MRESVKVKIPDLEPRWKETHIFLPFYRYQFILGRNEAEIFTKVEIDGDGFKETKIQRATEHSKPPGLWSLLIQHISALNEECDNLDYMFGQGDYQLTEEAFNEVLAEFKTLVTSI